MGHREWPPGPCGHAVGVRAGQVAQDSEGPAAGSEEEEETPPCLGDGVLSRAHFRLPHSAVDFGATCTFFFLIKDFFFTRPIFKVLTEFVTILFLSYVLALLAARHVGSNLPDQESSPHPLQWKARS